MTVRLLPNITGRIVAVGTTIDPTTRSVTVKAQIPAGAGIVDTNIIPTAAVGGLKS